MKTTSAIGIATVGGAIVYQLLSKERRDRLASAMERGMARRMGHAMDSLPDDAPPKLVKQGIPKLQEQNEEILELLREQNELLKERKAQG